jgi:hypothetical protein
LIIYARGGVKRRLKSSFLNPDSRDAYFDKKLILDAAYPSVSARDFYRLIFPSGTLERGGHYEDHRPNGILMEVLEDGRIHRHILFDELEEIGQLQGNRFAFAAPIGYFGKKRDSKHARFLYAMAFDLDAPKLEAFLYAMEKGLYARPTFIVSSGTGIHLYYVLDRPVPLYPQNQKGLKNLKFLLTRRLWNGDTSRIEKPQMQGIFQGFRVVGSASKLGADYPVRAWRSGPRISMDDLISSVSSIYVDGNKPIGEEGIKPLIYEAGTRLDVAKKKWPDWYQKRIVEGNQQRDRWHIKRDLYDWWIDRMRRDDDLQAGHRYFAMMCLAIYARKCDVSEEELRHDALGLIPVLNHIRHETGNEFTREDMESALTAYADDYCTFPRDSISSLTGLPMPHNRRNHRTQKLHIQLMTAQRDVLYPEGSWRNKNGRPTGTGQKKEAVLNYISGHPAASPTEIAREVGTTRKTVYKYLRRPQGS